MGEPQVSTRELLDRLQRHYIKPGQTLPGGVFLPECGWNGDRQGSRCDALYVGFTSTSGRLLVGHEIKVSRTDWRRELDKSGKADEWHDECHAWYIVAPSTEVVPVEELPAGWGLMLPNPRTKTRMDVKVKATVDHHPTPSWTAVRSIIARQDTLRAQAIAEVSQNAHEKARSEVVQQQKARAEAEIPWDVRRRLEALERLEAALGVEIDAFPHQGAIAGDTFGAALRLVQAAESLPHARRSHEALRMTEEAAKFLTEIGEAIAELRSELAPHRGGAR